MRGRPMIEDLFSISERSWAARALAHALVELGHPLECEMPACLFDDRSEFSQGIKDPQSITFDHIDGRADDHPRNLRFAHRACNTSGANKGSTRYPLSEAHKEKIRKALTGRKKAA